MILFSPIYISYFRFQDFARDTLIKPIIVNVGRAGAANLDVIQEVEYVKDDVKIPYLLQCLQKTAPPVIIFCERKGDVGKPFFVEFCLCHCLVAIISNSFPNAP